MADPLMGVLIAGDDGGQDPLIPDSSVAINTSRGLGIDPATGGTFRQSEYDTALRIQEERGVVLTRSSEQSGVDWVDKAGNTYDAVGNFPSRYFDQRPQLQTRILDHVAYADYVPVDVSQFTADRDRAAIHRTARTTGLPGRPVMAGTVFLTDDKRWSTSSWMFDFVVRSIASETHDAQLAAHLREIEDEHLGSLYLPGLSASQRAEVERVIRDRLVARAEQDLPRDGSPG